MKNVPKILAVLILCLLSVGLRHVCLAMDVDALQALLNQGEKVTVIDIRSREAFAEGHIHGAINIAAGIIDRKPFPPVGRVVVCGDGVRKNVTQAAVTALNGKAGIQAEILEGGFAAWEARHFPRTQRPGMKKSQTRFITYQELEKVSTTDQPVVLVDARNLGKGDGKTREQKAGTSAENASALCDLSGTFPGMAVIRVDDGTLKGGGQGQQIPLASFAQRPDAVYVIIDSGNGTAERVARRMVGAGMKQALILIGGERTLQKEGRSGSRTQISGDSF